MTDLIVELGKIKVHSILVLSLIHSHQSPNLRSPSFSVRYIHWIILSLLTHTLTLQTTEQCYTEICMTKKTGLWHANSDFQQGLLLHVLLESMSPAIVACIGSTSYQNHSFSGRWVMAWRGGCLVYWIGRTMVTWWDIAMLVVVRGCKVGLCLAQLYLFICKSFP